MHTYASVQDIRDRGVSQDAADDLTVTRALGRATLLIDGYCGRDFLRREETYHIDGTGRPSVFLDDRPVIEITALKVDGHPVDSASYRLYGEAGYVRLNGCITVFAGHPGVFAVGVQNVEVNGLFGFEETPPEVKEACILLALAFVRSMKAEANVSEQQANSTDKAIGIKRVKVDDLSVEFQYPRDTTVGASRRKTTGVVEADRLLWRFRRDLEATAI
ncbi:MAG: hypothetical protein ACYS9X_11735 [Planctomycetota bacterium]